VQEYPSFFIPNILAENKKNRFRILRSRSLTDLARTLGVRALASLTG
jgi:hypothetical protein